MRHESSHHEWEKYSAEIPSLVVDFLMTDVGDNLWRCEEILSALKEIRCAESFQGNLYNLEIGENEVFIENVYDRNVAPYRGDKALFLKWLAAWRAREMK